MNKTDFIAYLQKLDLPREKFIILSGGSLLMRGLREQTADLDITVSKKLAADLDLYNKPKDENGLYMPFDNVQMMADMEQFRYDIIDGYQCESLQDILRQKRQWNRPKDRKDIAVIEKVIYKDLLEQARSLTEGVPWLVSNLANLSALLYQTLDSLNWAGFYLVEGSRLILGPFQGKPACLEIPFGKGVCGTAAQEDRIVIVPDVHQFPGHIACDSASESEIVIPVHKNGKVIGVLDIDSPVKGRFTEADGTGLKTLVDILEAVIESACQTISVDCFRHR